MKMIKQFLLLLMLIGLFSCVMEPTKQTIIKKIDKIVDVDSDVEDDFDLALVQLKNEKYDEAIVLLEKVIAKEKRLPAPFVNLGMAYNKKGDFKKAEQNLLWALKIKLTHPVANNQLGLLYRKKGRFNDARKAYTNALTEYPDNLSILKNLGILCEIYMRDLPCALKQYEHYLSLRPNDKTMKIWLADLNQRLK